MNLCICNKAPNFEHQTPQIIKQCGFFSVSKHRNALTIFATFSKFIPSYTFIIVLKISYTVFFYSQTTFYLFLPIFYFRKKYKMNQSDRKTTLRLASKSAHFCAWLYCNMYSKYINTYWWCTVLLLKVNIVRIIFTFSLLLVLIERNDPNGELKVQK